VSDPQGLEDRPTTLLPRNWSYGCPISSHSHPYFGEYKTTPSQPLTTLFLVGVPQNLSRRVDVLSHEGHQTVRQRRAPDSQATKGTRQSGNEGHRTVRQRRAPDSQATKGTGQSGNEGHRRVRQRRAPDSQATKGTEHPSHEGNRTIRQRRAPNIRAMRGTRQSGNEGHRIPEPRGAPRDPSG
jgi:hypothetical protein